MLFKLGSAVSYRSTVAISVCLLTRNFRSRYEKKEFCGRTPSSDDDGNFIAAPRREKERLPQPPPSAEPPSLSLAPPPGATTPGGASCNVFETNLESLQTELGVRKLFADLNLRVSEKRTWSVVEAGATNTRGGEKRRTVPLEYCRQRIISNDRGKRGKGGKEARLI